MTESTFERRVRLYGDTPAKRVAALRDVEVEVIERGTYNEGRVLWLRIDAPRDEARDIAETYGRVTESDVADDGRQSFSVIAEGSDRRFTERYNGEAWEVYDRTNELGGNAGGELLPVATCPTPYVAEQVALALEAWMRAETPEHDLMAGGSA
jgi:hypothetical protein